MPDYRNPVHKFDRTVHATLDDGGKIVRYDRAGKWYIEYKDRQRRALTLTDAAWWAVHHGVHIYFDVIGGRQFDTTVRRLLAEGRPKH